MTDAARWFLLSGAILNALMATVLYRAVGRSLIYWYMSFFQFPRLLRRLLSNDTLVRAWGIASSIVCLALWWYLGTPHGDALLADITRIWR